MTFSAAAVSPATQAVAERPDKQAQLRAISLEYDSAELALATLDWHQSRRLGTGSYGAVYRGELRDGSEVAVKAIDLGTLAGKPECLKDGGFEEEVQMLSKFRHPNLVTLMGWGQRGLSRYLVYEYLAGGDVFQRLRKSRMSIGSKAPGAGKPFHWYERLSVCLDAATGLSHMHNSSPKAFHRDIKSANVLLDRHGTAKMADFGLSCTSGSALHVTAKTVCGTPGYTCPIYQRTGRCTEGSEVHAFGMLVLEMITGLSPSTRDAQRPGGLRFPVADAVRPTQPGAVERCVQSLDILAAWPTALTKELAGLALRCVCAHSEQLRPRFVEAVRTLRGLVERDRDSWSVADEPSESAELQEDWQAPADESIGATTAGASAVDATFAAEGLPVCEVAPAGVGGAGAGSPLAPGPPAGAGAHTGAGPAPPVATSTPEAACSGGIVGAEAGASPLPERELLRTTPRTARTTPRAASPSPPAAALGAEAPAKAAVVEDHDALQKEKESEVPFCLEVVMATGIAAGSLPLKYQRMPLAPAVPTIEDGESRLSVTVGRQHQPRFFELVLPSQSQRILISRTAFKISWSPGKNAAWLLPCGTNTLSVDARVVRKGTAVPLRFGAELRFSYERRLLLHLRFAAAAGPGPGAAAPLVDGLCLCMAIADAGSQPAEVALAAPEGHEAVNAPTDSSELADEDAVREPQALLRRSPERTSKGRAAPAKGERASSCLPELDPRRRLDFGAAAAPSGAARAASPQRVAPPVALVISEEAREAAPSAWRLVCVHSECLRTSELAALSHDLRGFDIPLGVTVGGWGHQSPNFEAWLPDPILRYSISRAHFRLEVIDGALSITNSSFSTLCVDKQPLSTGEMRALSAGQTVSFARQEGAGAVHFLQLRVQGPCLFPDSAKEAPPPPPRVAPSSQVDADGVAPYQLEVLAAAGLALESLSPELRRLPLVPAAGVSSGAEGKAVSVPIGRQHQPRLFAAWLPAQGQRILVSRTACEVSWTPGSNDGAWLVTRGTNPISVEGRVARPGVATPLWSGAELRFTFERKVILHLRFYTVTATTRPAPLHASSGASAGAGSQPVPPASASASAPVASRGAESGSSTGVLSSAGAVESDAVSAVTDQSRPPGCHRERVAQPDGLVFATLGGVTAGGGARGSVEKDGAASATGLPASLLSEATSSNGAAGAYGGRRAALWHLACVRSEELSTDALSALPPELRGFDVADGMMLGGWGHQTRHFEAWLPDPILRYSISRTHLRLEASDGALTITNLSLDILRVDGESLTRGEPRSLMEGQVLSFTRPEATGAVCFLELQLQRA